jgi:fibronectin type 3 domain-containing protein
MKRAFLMTLLIAGILLTACDELNKTSLDSQERNTLTVTGLTVTSTTTTSVELTWTAVTGATSFRIYRADLATSPNYNFVDETRYNSYIHSNIAPNTT